MSSPGRIRRGYITTGSGQLHYRSAGQGPVVVLLPEPPRSSSVYTPLMERFADEFTLIALDLPGYGNSPALNLPGPPTVSHFAARVAEALGALGVQRYAVYGYHGSSKIALQLAVTQPARVAIAVLDGLSLPLEMPDAQFLQRYLPPFELSDDGSHLAREWTRLLDAHRFYPWFARSERARLNTDLPDAVALHDYALDLFSAGAHYAVAPLAIQRCDARQLLQQAEARIVVMAREDDFLYRALDALPENLSTSISVERIKADAEEWRTRLRLILREHCDRASRPKPLERHTPPAAAELSGYVDLAHGQVHVRCRGTAGGRPVLLLHEAPGSSAQLRPLMQELAAERPVFAIDLPGLGDSDPVPNPEVANYKLALLDLLDALQLHDIDLFAEFTATPLAIELARTAPERVHRMTLDGVFFFTASERRALRKQFCPPITPARDGTHLLALWQRLRDQELSWPWYESGRSAVRRRTPDIGASRLHPMLVDIMKQPAHYGELCLAAFEYPVKEMLEQIRHPVLLTQIAGDTRYQWVSRAARRLAERSVVTMPATTAEQARQWSSFFSAG
ncbi:MAG TPA: alpha/beta hydrolase [Steroidobacteraceae bacterium]|nr:alpha/beta hydrolase [Steroidobacteraceae bacterium]